MTKKRGNPQSQSPEVCAEMERLWTETTLTHEAMAESINAKFGSDLAPSQVKNRADRNGWYREAMAQSLKSPAMIEQKLRTETWLRWAEPGERPPDNAVRKVTKGTFPAKQGFRIGGGM